MREITKGSHWDLYIEYQKATGRTRPEYPEDDEIGDYIAWLEDQYADHFEAQQYAKQIMNLKTWLPIHITRDMNGNAKAIKFRKTQISEAHNIQALYNEATCELLFIKHGSIIDRRDMTGYTDKQIEKYLQGIIDGLKT